MHEKIGTMSNFVDQDFGMLSKQKDMYQDKTQFIAKLEKSGTVLIFLRPPNYGKSVIISMLHHYYDILRKEKFAELFGHLQIGQNPTPEANSYLIFSIRFAASDTTVESLHKRINDSAKEFVSQYKNHPECKELVANIKIDEEDAINSFWSIDGAVSGSKFRQKVCFMTLLILVAVRAS